MRTRNKGFAASIIGLLLAIGLVGCLADDAAPAPAPTTEPAAGEVDRAQPASTAEAPELLQALRSCEGTDGTRCTIKGQHFACDNGEPGGGLCFCAGFTYVCN